MTAEAPAPLAEQIGELKIASAKRLPVDVQAIFASQVQEVSAAGVPAGVATVGTPVPNVEMLDVLGASTSLHAAAGEGPAVLVFYRGTWCPYCNLALRAYGEQLFPELVERGIALVAISPQKADGSLSMKEKHQLAFPVLTDAGNALAGQLGVLAGARSDDVRSAQERLGLDLPATNADGTETIPMPTVVILDAEHTIRWIDVRPDYTDRIEAADILQAVGTVV